AVSLTIDDDTFLKSITEELEKFALVAIDKSQSIVCLVGHSIIFHEDTHRLFKVLQDINVRMISYGGSNNNISLLVHMDDKVATLKKVHSYVFEGEVLA
ncbi:MAG: aspartate kinase, partial [Flavobacteriaceae bacterium]